MSGDTEYTKRSTSKIMWWLMGILGTVFTLLLSAYLKSITGDIEENHSEVHKVRDALAVKSEQIVAISTAQAGIDKQLSELKADSKEQNQKLDLILRKLNK